MVAHAYITPPPTACPYISQSNCTQKISVSTPCFFILLKPSAPFRIHNHYDVTLAASPYDIIHEIIIHEILLPPVTPLNYSSQTPAGLSTRHWTVIL